MGIDEQLTPDFFSCLKGPLSFYILRHGQSEGNAAKVLQGRGEYSLSGAGRDQAAARGRSLKTIFAGGTATGGEAPEAGENKPLFFSSPQSRARETAEIIAKEAGLSAPRYMDELQEMSLGIWTGKTWDEVKKETPSLWADFMAKSWDAIPEAESSADLYERALRIWAVLRDAAAAENAEKVIVVTHGGLIQWLIKATFQSRSWFPLLPISNCGLFKFCVEPNEKGIFMCWEEIDSRLPTQAAGHRGFPS